MNMILQKIIAAAATAGLGWLANKFGPAASATAVAIAGFVANHYFHKQLPPGITDNVGNP